MDIAKAERIDFNSDFERFFRNEEKTKQAEIKTIIEMTDAFFGGVKESRAMTKSDKLDMVKAFIKTASMEDCQTIISELIERVSEEVGIAHHLEEAFAELGKEL